VLVAKNGVVTHVAVEEPGAFEVSKAETVLAAL
jgi:peroxiredoxin (alkyl hydroperoxide reductase subunit C)